MLLATKIKANKSPPKYGRGNGSSSQSWIRSASPELVAHGCIRLHSLGNVTRMARGPLAPADPSAQQTHTKPGGRTWKIGAGKSTGLEPGPLSSCASVSPLQSDPGLCWGPVLMLGNASPGAWEWSRLVSQLQDP